jgi:hypothetical protein
MRPLETDVNVGMGDFWQLNGLRYDRASDGEALAARAGLADSEGGLRLSRAIAQHRCSVGCEMTHGERILPARSAGAAGSREHHLHA